MISIIDEEFICDFCGGKHDIADDRYDIQPVMSHKNCIKIPPINICESCYNKIMDYFEDGKFNFKDSLLASEIKVVNNMIMDVTKKKEPMDVTRPDHYCKGRTYEPKNVIRDWGLNFNLGNVVKYVARAGHKENTLLDLKKARQYLTFEINALMEENGIEENKEAN